MLKLVILITARVEVGHEIGEAWQRAGAPGVTLIGSYGLRSLQQARQSSEVLAGMLSMHQIFREMEETSLIVLSVVENDGLVDRLVEATERIVGRLEEPHNGVIFVLDVERSFGMRHHSGT